MVKIAHSAERQIRTRRKSNTANKRPPIEIGSGGTAVSAASNSSPKCQSGAFTLRGCSASTTLNSEL